MHAGVAFAVPFAGLGFDLAPVRAVALQMTALRTCPRQPVSRPAPTASVPGRWGYGLMLHLGRETRGR